MPEPKQTESLGFFLGKPMSVNDMLQCLDEITDYETLKTFERNLSRAFRAYCYFNRQRELDPVYEAFNEKMESLRPAPRKILFGLVTVQD